MIVFVGVFSFASIPVNYMETGTHTISLLLLGAVAYFLPLSLIMAELGVYAKNRTSGIYSWLEVGLGKKWAYYGLWFYFVGNIFYLPYLSSRAPVYLMFSLTGSSTIQNHTAALLSLIFLAIALLIGIKFEKFFYKISIIPGYILFVISVVFVAAGLIVYALHGFAPHMTPSDFVIDMKSKKEMSKVFGTFAWILYAYNGSELVGPYIIKAKRPEKSFMRGLLISTIFTSALYVLGILAMQVFASPAQVAKLPMINAVINPYVFMARYFGLGLWFVRTIGVAYTIIVTISLVMWSVMLARAVFSEVPAGTFPAWLMRKNKNGILRNALLFETALVILFTFMTAYGGKVGSRFFEKVYDMTTMTLVMPYLFLGLAYINFRRKRLVAPYQVCKNRYLAYLIGGITVFLSVIAVVFAGYDFSQPVRPQIPTFELYYGGLLLFLVIGIAVKVIKFKKDELPIARSLLDLEATSQSI